MAAIGAIVDLDGQSVERADLQRIADALPGLGPGGCEFQIAGPAGMFYGAHPFTPEDRFEQQPMRLGDGSLLLFDGRLDNRSDLARTLNMAASELAGLPDGALVRRAFERWGEACFARLIGPFAIIVWLAGERRLLMARDAMGMRPLCYGMSPQRNEHRLAVASMPKGVLATGWLPPALDEDRLADFLILNNGDPDATYFRHVKKVRPAHLLELRQGTLQMRPFWRFEDIPDVRFARDEDYVEAFTERFDEVIGAQMRSLGQVGAFMSGGLDSSSIAVTAARMLPSGQTRLPVFTSIPEEAHQVRESRSRYEDETPFVEAIAAMVPALEPTLSRSSGMGLFSYLDEMMEAMQAPSVNIINQYWGFDFNRRAQSQGITTMLIGDLGNITISYGAPFLLASALRRGDWRCLGRELRHLPPGSRAKAGYLLHRALFPLLPSWLWRNLQRLRWGEPARWGALTLIDSDFAAECEVLRRAKRFGFDPWFQPDANQKRQRAGILWRSSHFAGDAYAAHQTLFGIDMRDPTGDRRLVEFCLGIPESQYQRQGNQRWLIRRAMKERLPDMVLDNPKRGKQTADWRIRLQRDKERIRREWQSLSEDQRLLKMADKKRIQQLLDRWQNGQSIDEAALELSFPRVLAALLFARHHSS